jgi:lipoprotein-anchoring transpeptidase ErfK/SrfK
MSLPRHLCGLTLAALVMASGLISASSAKAEDLVDFLWGGSPEYGGGRSVVSFNPKYKPGQIIVSFSDRRLYWIMKPGQALTYPVAIPTGEARWQGVTSVTSKRVNPPWTPTPDMVRNNPRLPRWVPGGHPMNPLGIRAMYLGTSAYRIHGTDAPWTIGQAVSHGCIRMTNADVLDLYPRVPVGTRVTVTWQQFKTQTISDGSNLPRYTDKDSNPRAAAAPSKSSEPASASAESAPASSSPASYSYSAYGSGKASSAREVSHQSTGGGLESLFFWAEEPKKPEEAAPAEDPDRDQASRDATKDDADLVADRKQPEEQKKLAEGSDHKTAEKAPKKIHEASVEPEHRAEPAASKKKVSSASPAKKKSTTAAAAKIPTASDPSFKPATMAVPDPVKPTSVSAPTKQSEATIPATKASASASEAARVQKASVQVQ